MTDHEYLEASLMPYLPPTRIVRKRAKGWRKPPGSVIVDRTSKWGNPYTKKQGYTQKQCARLHARLIDREVNGSPHDWVPVLSEYRSFVHSNWYRLAGRDLVCWCCRQDECHADNLIKFCNPIEGEDDGLDWSIDVSWGRLSLIGRCDLTGHQFIVHQMGSPDGPRWIIKVVPNASGLGYLFDPTGIEEYLTAIEARRRADAYAWALRVSLSD